MRTLGCALLVIVILTPLASPLCAQRAAPDVEQSREPASLRPLRVAKWTTLAAAAGAATWGFIQNHRADGRFADLERQCNDEPDRCALRLPGGAYQDPEFERLYQQIRSHDRRAWVALLLSQVSVGTSVVLFLLDLGNAKRPPDIPFVPTAVNFAKRPDGAVQFSIALPLPGR
ncbi:MAG: hypothetical protein L0271_03915 [Gemmatimonadetes bacterium]|nr:hypothetical protein [Gemmatimonadota bacterium]